MAGAGKTARNASPVSRPRRLLKGAFSTLILVTALSAGAARANVSALENRLQSHCLSRSGGNTQGCTCLITALRRELPPGGHEASLALILVGLEGSSSANGITIPADVRNRYALTPQRLQQLMPAAQSGYARAANHCSKR